MVRVPIVRFGRLEVIYRLQPVLAIVADTK